MAAGQFTFVGTRTVGEQRNGRSFSRPQCSTEVPEAPADETFSRFRLRGRADTLTCGLTRGIIVTIALLVPNDA